MAQEVEKGQKEELMYYGDYYSREEADEERLSHLCSECEFWDDDENECGVGRLNCGDYCETFG